MPQLDATTFPAQLFWLAVTFIVLYGLMRWLALPRVERVITGRREHLNGDLARAADLKAEAEAALAAYQKTLAGARAAAQTTLRETADRLAAEAAERQQRLSATLAEQIEAAERRIAAMKEEALAEVRGIATDVGGAVVEKLTGAAADPAQLAAAVDHAAGRAA
ncbi:MAG TPA: F0F1 ATP synthase subunit B' [Stellaceae bacterium]|nr:F0F1 ATP synthase subunit B' [Stellaceae bacterium]